MLRRVGVALFSLLIPLACQAADAAAPEGVASGSPILLRAQLVPPVSPACISSPYGPRVLPGRPQAGTFHDGVDLPAPLGTPVRAAADGLVLRIERFGPGGLEMLIQHAGFVGIYSHFGSIAPLFAEGAKTVKAGEKLGVVGLTGVTFGPHLYFGMKVEGRPVDPGPFLNLPSCGSGRRVGGSPVLLSADGKLLPERILPMPTRGTGWLLAPVRLTSAHYHQRRTAPRPLSRQPAP